MVKIDWKQDYQGEFICPKCQALKMTAWGIDKINNKRKFHCSRCNHTCQESCLIDIKLVTDPSNHRVIWYKNYKINGLICPNCNTENIFFLRIDNYKKKYSSVKVAENINMTLLI